MALKLASTYEPTTLTEIPVIVSNGEVQIFIAELANLSPASLNQLAMVMDGTVEYLKVRAHYEVVRSGRMDHCTAQGCWRPASSSDSHRCDSHPMALGE